MHASQKGHHLECVCLLLDAGADVAQDAKLEGWTALMAASQQGRLADARHDSRAHRAPPLSLAAARLLVGAGSGDERAALIVRVAAP